MSCVQGQVIAVMNFSMQVNFLITVTNLRRFSWRAVCYESSKHGSEGGKGTPCLHGITCPTLQMESVLVLNYNNQSLAPTHPARARKLLSTGSAEVVSHAPFTIRLACKFDAPPAHIQELVERGATSIVRTPPPNPRKNWVFFLESSDKLLVSDIAFEGRT